MRTMYDSVTADNIPAEAEMVAGYVDGKYKWTEGDWARFPQAVKVRIAVLPSTNDGEVLDVEPGNGTPAESVDWVLMRRAAGVIPTVYCGLSMWQSCKQAFLNRGVAEPHWWIAHYDGKEEIPIGAIAKQYDSNHLFDLSIVADHWAGIDKETEPEIKEPEPAPPAPREPGLDQHIKGNAHMVLRSVEHQLANIQKSLDDLAVLLDL